MKENMEHIFSDDIPGMPPSGNCICMEEDPRNFQDLFEPDFPENRNLLPGNEAIMASAGTGKTFSLAMRYICLLHAGVLPEGSSPPPLQKKRQEKSMTRSWKN